jgi:hypothetical protein
MAEATGLQQAIDNRGFPYAAVRPRVVQLLATTTGGTASSAALQPQTRVVRITCSTDTKVTFAGGAIAVVSPGSYQDFIVYPTDVLGFQALTAAGAASLAELM